METGGGWLLSDKKQGKGIAVTDHRDHGDENDNYMKDRKFKSGELVRNMVSIHVSVGDSLYEETISAVNKLLEWCDWKDIQPMEFGADTEVWNDLIHIWVKGVQR